MDDPIFTKIFSALEKLDLPPILLNNHLAPMEEQNPPRVVKSNTQKRHQGPKIKSFGIATAKENILTSEIGNSI